MITKCLMASKPKTMQDAIKFATELMDKKINTFDKHQADNKRKFDHTSKNNQKQQQQNKRQNTGRPYTAVVWLWGSGDGNFKRNAKLKTKTMDIKGDGSIGKPDFLKLLYHALKQHKSYSERLYMAPNSSTWELQILLLKKKAEISSMCIDTETGTNDGNKKEHEEHLKAIMELLKKEELYAKFSKCLVGYYRRFIEGFSKIAKLMTKLTQNGFKFDWGDKEEAAFQLIKQKLCLVPPICST
ncbi:hypothetical protein Tco_0683155 [Tanacetum coccineum]|uniref:Reverse transcriptase domain-containing protein n=1 Tax=Tanacetum coccineum TaxID=301880 RepID=A0ABQ4XUU0_9ASTR